MSFTNHYGWGGLAIFFWAVSGYTLVHCVRTPGPYAEESILLGGTLGGLGVAAVFFAVRQGSQLRAMARHMRWNSGDFEGSEGKTGSRLSHN
jgi:hypothetical protein